jgi:hypothetical protein
LPVSSKKEKRKGNYKKETRSASRESNWFPVDTGNEDGVPDDVCGVFIKRLVFTALKLASLTEHALVTPITAPPLRGHGNASFYAIDIVMACLLAEEVHLALNLGNIDKDSPFYKCLLLSN